MIHLCMIQVMKKHVVKECSYHKEIALKYKLPHRASRW